MLGVAQQNHHKNHMKICKHKETRYHLKILMESFKHKGFNKWCGSHLCTKIWKPKSRVRKLGGNEIEWSNPWGFQTTHFTDYIERPNTNNYSYNRKNVGTTFDARPIICVSSAKERKTQVRWVVVIRWKVRIWAKENNIPPNWSPCHVPNFNEMTMRSLCREA
jgi:hypothetical protein